MDQKHLIVASSRFLLSDPACEKMLARKERFPLGGDIGFLTPEAQLDIKLRSPDGGEILVSSASLESSKDTFCLRVSTEVFRIISQEVRRSDYLFIIIEGSPQQASVIVRFVYQKEDLFTHLEAETPTLRLAVHDLPPSSITSVDAPSIRGVFYSYLLADDPALFSFQAQRFLRSPHILTQLFSHVMSLKSSDHINYIATLKAIADHLRTFLDSRIRTIEKNHNALWTKFYGERISFVDGGLSRIVSLPGTEPMGIRVGVYTVIPGETDLEKRETWDLTSHVIGDVLSDRSVFDDDEAYTDRKRLQEAARYIIEPLVALRHAARQDRKPKVVLLHGPLQNSFETYDESEPCYIPGVDRDFLSSFGLTESDIRKAVQDIPSNARSVALWNVAVPVYACLMNRVFEQRTSIMGVVERSRSSSFTKALLADLVEEGAMPGSTERKLRSKLDKFEISDELLLGCVLEQGEYIEPIRMRKNLKRRAHDRWRRVIEDLPTPFATMVKCSATNFPFRVEFNSIDAETKLPDLMSLVYHTSLLLPEYAFPVGIDIADKYAKIPDWLSKGISATLTATVLSKVLATGDSKMLAQVRRLLALSPRDFFFRPKA